MIDNNIMPTSGPKEIDPITIAKIKQKSQDREYEIVDDPIGRIKLKNYTCADSAVRNKKIYVYYCSLCGELALVSSFSLTQAPRRRTDAALILVDSEDVAVQRYFKAGPSKVIKRENGYEHQWVWECRACEVELAYQSLPHESRMLSEVAPLFALTEELQKTNLYLLPNTLATSPSYAEVFK